MSSEGSPLLLNTSMMMSRTCQSQHSPLGQRLSYTVLKPLPLNIWEYKKRLLTKTSLTGKSIPEWCTAEFLKNASPFTDTTILKVPYTKTVVLEKVLLLFRASKVALGSLQELPHWSLHSFKNAIPSRSRRARSCDITRTKHSSECIHCGTELNTDSPVDHLGKSTECVGGIQNG